MTRARNGLRWAALIMAGVATAAVIVVFDPFASLFSDEAGEASVERNRAELSTASLTRTVEAEGELRFAEQRILGSTETGTLIATAELGQPVPPSSVLFEVDSSPTIAMVGDVPAWRTMTMDDVGVDVAQLEANLVSLGYDQGEDLAVDETYTDFTAALVEEWQQDMGFEVTGVVAFGQVAFVPDGATITSISAAAGQTLQGIGATGQTNVLTVSSSVREVTFAVQAEDLHTVDIGTEVSARLPDRTNRTAIVNGLGPTGDGSWLATAALQPAGDAAVLPAGEVVPVTVSWDEIIAADVMTVRANALTRLDSGIYALEVVESDGSTDFVAVSVGAQSGSIVELVTDLAPGTEVIAP